MAPLSLGKIKTKTDFDLFQDLCHQSPCLNGGACLFTTGPPASYFCTCTDGFTVLGLIIIENLRGHESLGYNTIIYQIFSDCLIPRITLPGISPTSPRISSKSQSWLKYGVALLAHIFIIHQSYIQPFKRTELRRQPVPTESLHKWGDVFSHLR